MAGPTKKVARSHDIGNENGGESTSESDYDSDQAEQGYTGGETIQVSFEGRSPIDSDFHGIKQLLKQLFLKAHINLSEITDIVISQNNIGSVVKQSNEDEDMDDDDDDEDDINDVFGLTTVINLSNKIHMESIKQFIDLLKELSKEHADERIQNFIIKLFEENNSKHVGLLIHERFVNIPTQISIPLLQGLSKEIKNAKAKQMPYDFQYYILISKLYKIDASSSKKKSKKNQNQTGQQNEPDILWSNAEEEVFDQEADLKFEFSVKNETDSGLVGGWMEDDTTMTPYRKVMIISANKMDIIIDKISTFIN